MYGVDSEAADYAHSCRCEGSVDVVSETNGGVVVDTLEEGGYFGEVALLLNESRAHSVVSRTRCTIFVLHLVNLRKIMGPPPALTPRPWPRGTIRCHARRYIVVVVIPGSATADTPFTRSIHTRRMVAVA